MSNDAGSGGTAEDLADLIDLELDRTKNQYETFQAGQQQKREEALDDALEKLKELAKRQEQQIERRKRDGSLEGESLVEEIEELSRRLARLSRQEREEQLSKLSRELDRAARDLRRSLSSGQGAERATALAQQAMQRLKTAQDVLRKQRRNQLQERMNELESVARQLVVDQDEVVDEMRSLDRKIQKKEIDQDFLKQHRAMLRKQGDLQVDLQKLEGDLHQLARQMDSREKTAARKLRQVGLKIRDERLPERMEEGFELAARGLMNMAVHREEQIGRELQTLAKSLSEVKRSLGQAQMETPEERRQRALGEVGDLVEKLDSLWDRLEPIQKDSKNLSGGQKSGFTGEPTEQSAGARGFSEGEAERTLNGIEPSQLKREWERRVQEAAQLRELLRNDRDLGSDVSQILKRMRQVDLERVLADKDEVARLKSRVLDNLLQLELELNQFLRQSDSHYFRPVGGNNVPSEFRESVEEYHRRLSEK
jgi:hypothetical protein